MRVVYLPIEPLEERYSKDWLEWTRDFLWNMKKLNENFKFDILLPNIHGMEKINNGQFLDCIKTNAFKAKQLEMAVNWIESNDPLDNFNDVIFYIQDGWFPGIEMLAYIRDTMGYGYKLAACLHAGTWDYYDFINQKGMRQWASNLELSWLSIYDNIFVATKFHRKLINSYHPGYLDKIKVTGFPIAPVTFEEKPVKENIVVFPHRLAPEKVPELFEVLENRAKSRYDLNISKYRFIKSKEVTSNKNEYYELLGKAEFAVSFAVQETWGIAMQEAVLCDCYPIVPDRLSYSEMYPEEFKYSTPCRKEDIADAIIDRMERILIVEGNGTPNGYSSSLEKLKTKFLLHGNMALTKQFEYMVGRS